MICTEGDVLAERVRQDPLGITVAPGDVRGYAEAILRLVKDKDFYQRCRGNMPAVKEELSWERVLTPLVEFCRSTQGMAAPKRQRLPPLIRRAARYWLTHSWQQVVTRQR